MKVYQIVSEVGFLSALKTGYNAFKGARSAVPKAASVAKDTADDATSWVARGVEKVTGNATSVATKAQYARAAEIAAQHYGSQTMKLFYALDIAKEVINYNYQAGKLDKSAPDYEEQLRTLRGKFITAIIAPKVTFSTEAGKKWLVDTFGVMITGIGTIPELAPWLVNVGTAVTQVATGNVPKDVEKTDLSGVDPTDPFSILQKAADSSGGRVDPFKGTGRGGK